jgi:histidine ammonia-lyase
MGMTGAIKLRAIVKLSELMTAIELIAAAQGLEYRAPLQPGRGVKLGRDLIRKYVSPLTADRAMSAEIEKVAQVIRSNEFDSLL